MSNPIKGYNSKDAKSIEEYAKKLLNKSLRQVIGNTLVQKYGGKGNFGQILEDAYFGIKPNSKTLPDFEDAGVEMKTNPLVKKKQHLVSKERLVFNIINYEEECKKTFKTSSFWTKNNLLLLMFFLYEKEKSELDYIFKIISLWKFPEEDLKIIQDDWEKIVSKIKEGKAHEISEGDTLYLGACTKGASKQSLRKQPYSEIQAMQRAFSLKQKYLNYIIADLLVKQGLIDKTLLQIESEPVVKKLKDYGTLATFEDLVISKFKAFYNVSEEELLKKFPSVNRVSKQRYYDFAKEILGIRGKHIEEFEKADVELKTIRLGKTGNLKESMSFAQIKFDEIVNEEWHDSYWFNTLTKRFFFVIFQEDDSGVQRLKKVMFWTMPAQDLEISREFWEDTREKIKKDDYSHFIKISDDKICHVRPKGKDSKDLMKTPSGRMEKKKCYWLNSEYIKRVVS